MKRDFNYTACTAFLRKVIPGIFLLGLSIILGIGTTHAEGTRQLEPPGAPSLSFCRLALTQNSSESRIPFALVGCDEVFRLNIRIRDYTSEKIYIGFGNITDYVDETSVYPDVKFQVKDPSGTVVPGFSLRAIPALSGTDGYIETRQQAYAGPMIGGTNADGYHPLVLSPGKNGDYVLEFEIPDLGETEARVFKYFDVTVANGNTPVTGRLWSKSWQLSSSSVNSAFASSFAWFYIYSNDSIVTRFDCNSLAGGIWTIYSNEYGCATTGSWSERRSSTSGNATVIPQYKIFLNDPDEQEFPTGTIGELLGFQMLPHDCDTAITFSATVSKSGNIEILLDIPPFNPGTTGIEDVQLGYNVEAGENILLPPWNGKDARNIPLSNGTVVETRIRFLNGLTNLPLFDVEDNPIGFKVDIQRPMQPPGHSKLRIFWDDTRLPSQYQPTANTLEGCLYSGSGNNSGCHDWPMVDDLGNDNTINSWWYYSSGDTLLIPVTLKLGPSSAAVNGPQSVCGGQVVTFRANTIPFATEYIWHITGPGTNAEEIRNAPDTTWTMDFTSHQQGIYTISINGRNVQCGDGFPALLYVYLNDGQPPPVLGPTVICEQTDTEFRLPGTYTSVEWSSGKGKIIGYSDSNPVILRWDNPGVDTLLVHSVSADCGTRNSLLPVSIHPLAKADFLVSGASTFCPGIPVLFNDNSFVDEGSILKRTWEWGDGQTQTGNDSITSHSFSETGTYPVILTVVTGMGCISSANRMMPIAPQPEAAFSVYRNCISDSIQLLDNSTGNEINSWHWDLGSASVQASNTDKQHPEAIFTSTGEFLVRLIIANRYGCSDTLDQKVVIHRNPQAAFSYPLLCQNSGILFSDNSIPADTTLNTYQWKAVFPSGDIHYQGNPVTMFFGDPSLHTIHYRITDHFGCSDTMTEEINVLPAPVCAFDFVTGEGMTDGTVHFRNNTTGATSYTWDFGNGEVSELVEPVTSYNTEGNYLVRLIAASNEGCYDTTAQSYDYFPDCWFPNAFKPDYDGVNDIFRPVTQRTTLEPYELSIFNSWGQMVFRSTNPSQGWDGTFKGKPCASGGYLFVVQYRTSGEAGAGLVKKTGTVILIR